MLIIFLILIIIDIALHVIIYKQNKYLDKQQKYVIKQCEEIKKIKQKQEIKKPGDIVKDDAKNNYGLVNDLIPIWKRKMKRSDFK